MSDPQKSYHHGDLHSALIVAAAELIEVNDSFNFSITDAARRAGVSSAAPYRHFKDKEALLEAVRDLAFLGLNNAMREAAQQTRDGSAEQIIALGIAYIDYALAKRAFFPLMWQARGDMVSRQEQARIKGEGFRILVEALEHHIARQDSAGFPTLRLATQMWSMVHGIATLECNHMLDTFDRQISSRQLVVDGTMALLATLPAKHVASDQPAQHSLAID